MQLRDPADQVGTFYTYLPRGCELCTQGAKLVLFITGSCNRDCFYCPLSQERRADLPFANERRVEKEEDILREAEVMDALGTGITGGEPLLKTGLTLKYIKLLKQSLGDNHHIHLYTSLAPPQRVLEELAARGIDEIRFHPPPHLWDNLLDSHYREAVTASLDLGMEAGLEVPALYFAPGLVDFLEETGCFLNLNELEFSETNADKLKKHGFELDSTDGFGARGSKEVAQQYQQYKIKLHYCPSRFKDAVQFRQRLKRTAQHTKRPFDEITEDGTLLYGVIETDHPTELKNMLKEIPLQLYPDRIETSWQVACKLAKKLKKKGCNVSIVERYPREDGIIVELTPLT